jgi:hypothetical protein
MLSGLGIRTLEDEKSAQHHLTKDGISSRALYVLEFIFIIIITFIYLSTVVTGLLER